jgi:GT2 family glycosyltransferase/tetratricopeptide (TPR) repeat protein
LTSRATESFWHRAILKQRFSKTLREANEARDRGLFVEAAGRYRIALDINPARTDLRVQMANMLKDAGRLDEAQTVYLRALSEDPQNADIHLQLGHVHKLAGRRSAAIKAYRAALGVDPELASAQRELSLYGEPSELRAAYDQRKSAGGLEELLSLKIHLDDVAKQIEDIRARLPEVEAITGFPIDAYADLRRLFDVPLPPPIENPAFHVSVLLAGDQESIKDLHKMLLAIRDQSCPRWSLTVFGARADTRAIVETAAAQDLRVRWSEQDATLSAAETELQLALTTDAPWILLLAPGARLHRQALAWFSAAIQKTDCEAIFVDEEVGDEGDFPEALRPVLRHAADPDSILETNTCGQTLAISATALAELGAELRPRSTAATRSAILLGAIGHRRIAHIPLPLVRRSPAAEALGEDPAAHSEAVQTHIKKIYPMHAAGRASASQSAIAVVIPTKNNSSDAAAMIESLCSLAQAPERLEILLLNNGRPWVADPLLAKLGLSPSITILDISEPFNWARFNNLGVQLTQAPCLIFANDDMEMLSQDWDAQVQTLLARSDVGAVGARLLYPDGAVQHAGILTNWPGSTIHDGLHRSADDPGPNLRWRLPRSAGAVTGAFLATRRATFEAVGGFDEVHFPISHNDVDYALRLRALGLRILWTPQITLTHYESKTRGLDHLDPAKAARAVVEYQSIKEIWPEALQVDPSINPFWLPAIQPFRLLRFPSVSAILNHINVTARLNPWQLASPKAGPADFEKPIATDRPVDSSLGRSEPRAREARADGGQPFQR